MTPEDRLTAIDVFLNVANPAYQAAVKEKFPDKTLKILLETILTGVDDILRAE